MARMYICRNCQHEFRGRQVSGGRSYCGQCMKSPGSVADAIVKLFEALKQSSEKCSPKSQKVGGK